MRSIQSITIQLPEPCHESWDAMQPNGCGRFCAACEKTVIDFTMKTDAEIVKMLSQSVVIPCGRFSSCQLDRPLLAGNKITTRSGIFSKLAASILFIQAMASTAWAQQRKNVTTTQTIHPADTNCSETIILEGIIKDYLNDDVRKFYNDYSKSRTKNQSPTGIDLYGYQDKLTGMELSITGTDYKAISDKNGRFKFVLPPSLKGKELIVKAAYQTGSSPERNQTKIRPVTVKFDGNIDHLSIEILRYDALSLEPVKIESSYPVIHRQVNAGAPIIRFQDSPTLGQKIKNIFKKKH